jgi:hypothetical protein
MHYLNVRQVMTKVVHAGRRSGSGYGIEPLAHGAVTERMEVHLETLSVQGDDGVIEKGRVDE